MSEKERQNSCLKRPYKELRKNRSESQRRIEKISHLNAEFQRLARRGKALSGQYKEIEENNKMRKIRDFFKKIRDTKGIYHTKMRTIKDRNGKDTIEAEEMKRKWQEYRKKKCIGKVLMTQITTMVWPRFYFLGLQNHC